MSAKNSDPRVQRTKAAFQQALLTLMREKSFAQIRIKEIAERAAFSRHAFYSHFDSKETLLFSCVDDLFSQIDEIVREDNTGVDRTELLELFKRCFDLWRSHAEMLRFVMQVDNQDFAITRFRQHIVTIINFYHKSRNLKTPQHGQIEYALEFFVGGIYALVKRWTFQGMPEDSDTMAKLMLEITPLELLIGIGLDE